MHKFTNSLRVVLAAALFAGLLTGCSKKEEKRIVIWTSNSEFAPYVEYFNSTHKEKAVLVYKENPAASLPPSSQDLQPDLIIGPLLRNEKTTSYFHAIDFLFDRKVISHNNFYKSLLKSGQVHLTQYLLPVSFNLPVIIFSNDNNKLISNSYTLSLDEIQKTGSEYNKTDKRGRYTNIGFAPQSSDEFLYTVTKIKGAAFKEGKNGTFVWNKEGLASSIAYINNWITTSNTSNQVESDFVYKYLSVTDDKRVTSGRSLFAFTTSDKLFQLSREQLAKIDFRWLENGGFIPVEDEMLMMGIYRKSKNVKGASSFISWFYKEDTQRALLEHKEKNNLEINTFGIAGGFSAIREVNEHILPVYYTTLLSNIPQAELFKVSEKKPVRWQAIKTKVVLPYIKDSVSTTPGKKIITLEEHYTEFKKQRFNQ